MKLSYTAAELEARKAQAAAFFAGIDHPAVTMVMEGYDRRIATESFGERRNAAILAARSAA